MLALGNLTEPNGSTNPCAGALRSIAYMKGIALGDAKAAYNLAILYREGGDFSNAEEYYGKYIEMSGYLNDYPDWQEE